MTKKTQLTNLMNLIERILMLKIKRHMAPEDFSSKRDKFIEEYYNIINENGGKTK